MTYLIFDEDASQVLDPKEQLSANELPSIGISEASAPPAKRAPSPIPRYCFGYCPNILLYPFIASSIVITPSRKNSKASALLKYINMLLHP